MRSNYCERQRAWTSLTFVERPYRYLPPAVLPICIVIDCDFSLEIVASGSLLCGIVFHSASPLIRNLLTQIVRFNSSRSRDRHKKRFHKNHFTSRVRSSNSCNCLSKASNGAPMWASRPRAKYMPLTLFDTKFSVNFHTNIHTFWCVSNH